MRGEFGSSARSSGGFSRSAPVYRGPAVVDNEPASEVAQVPDQGRTFSYEPSAPRSTARAAQPRTYSYEPSMRAPRARTFSYEPSMRRGMTRSRSNVPSYALPRTDARKHSGGI